MFVLSANLARTSVVDLRFFQYYESVFLLNQRGPTLARCGSSSSGTDRCRIGIPAFFLETVRVAQSLEVLWPWPVCASACTVKRALVRCKMLSFQVCMLHKECDRLNHLPRTALRHGWSIDRLHAGRNPRLDAMGDRTWFRSASGRCSRPRPPQLKHSPRVPPSRR